MLGAASTPCLGRMATWIAPNSGSPRAWASAPCSGDGTRSQPTLPASKASKRRDRRTVTPEGCAMHTGFCCLGLRLTRVGPESGRLGCAGWDSPHVRPTPSSL